MRSVGAGTWRSPSPSASFLELLPTQAVHRLRASLAGTKSNKRIACGYAEHATHGRQTSRQRLAVWRQLSCQTAWHGNRKGT